MASTGCIQLISKNRTELLKIMDKEFLREFKVERIHKVKVRMRMKNRRGKRIE